MLRRSYALCALLAYFRAFFAPTANKGKATAYLLPDDGGLGHAYRVVDLLRQHGIRVDRATDDFTVRDALVPSEALQTVSYYDKDADGLLISGYASAKNRRKLAGNAFAAVQPMGDGRVVFLVDNTQYRMFWVGPSRMMQNAVMLLSGM